MLGKCKSLCALALSALFAIFILLGIKLPTLCRLSALSGARTFYLDACGSNCLLAEEITLLNWNRIRGESVRFDRVEQGAWELAQEMLALYSAELLFFEEACGVVSFYAFSPELFKGVCVNGCTVNLHIAVSARQVAVGSPMIFGGF